MAKENGLKSQKTGICKNKNCKCKCKQSKKNNKENDSMKLEDTKVDTPQKITKKEFSKTNPYKSCLSDDELITVNVNDALYNTNEIYLKQLNFMENSFEKSFISEHKSIVETTKNEDKIKIEGLDDENIKKQEPLQTVNEADIKNGLDALEMNIHEMVEFKNNNIVEENINDSSFDKSLEQKNIEIAKDDDKKGENTFDSLNKINKGDFIEFKNNITIDRSQEQENIDSIQNAQNKFISDVLEVNKRDMIDFENNNFIEENIIDPSFDKSLEQNIDITQNRTVENTLDSLEIDKLHTIEFDDNITIKGNIHVNGYSQEQENIESEKILNEVTSNLLLSEAPISLLPDYAVDDTFSSNEDEYGQVIIKGSLFEQEELKNWLSGPQTDTDLLIKESLNNKISGIDQNFHNDTSSLTYVTSDAIFDKTKFLEATLKNYYPKEKSIKNYSNDFRLIIVPPGKLNSNDSTEPHSNYVINIELNKKDDSNQETIYKCEMDLNVNIATNLM